LRKIARGNTLVRLQGKEKIGICGNGLAVMVREGTQSLSRVLYSFPHSLGGGKLALRNRGKHALGSLAGAEGGGEGKRKRPGRGPHREGGEGCFQGGKSVKNRIVGGKNVLWPDQGGQPKIGKRLGEW